MKTFHNSHAHSGNTESAKAIPLDGLAEGALSTPRERAIFCNRTLHLDEIKAIGFDMDYTLACYKRESFDRLSRQQTIDKLGNSLGIAFLPESPIPDDFAIRGLVVDTQNGNLLKIDRHSVVGRAFHGTQRLSQEEIKSAYHHKKIGLGSERFTPVDSMFELPDVLLFAEAVDARGQDGGGPRLDHASTWKAIRAATDRSHRDGSLKSELLKSIQGYVEEDQDIEKVIHRFRSAGKSIFLMTNSDWYYTNRVMSYLLSSNTLDRGGWLSLFDAVVVSAKKPSFFTGTTEMAEAEGYTRAPGQDCKVMSGGNNGQLQEILGCEADEVLYIGDHIYHDIVRSKKGSGWRTALILRELEHDIFVRAAVSEDLSECSTIASMANQAARRSAHLRFIGRMGPVETDAEMALLRRLVAETEKHKEYLWNYLQGRSDATGRAFNPHWGSLFSTGNQTSFFGTQIESFSCIYTSRMSNLLYVSPVEYFEAMTTRMAHF